jgi:hypothetical protein
MTAGYLPISDRQRLRHSGPWQTAGIVAVMLAVASIPLSIAYGTLMDRQALEEDWVIAGPACPVVGHAMWFHRPPHKFSYQGVDFTRQYGSVSCMVLPDDGALSKARHTTCQFSSPAAVSVTAGGQTTIYEPGIGHPATVTIRDGRPSCVVGGWFE